MGQKVSAIHDVKSENYTVPGNAINQIWLGKLEIISRLPFGDTDLAQAGWPKGEAPKIPWHNFIIPLKRAVKRSIERFVPSLAVTDASPPPSPQSLFSPTAHILQPRNHPGLLPCYILVVIVIAFLAVEAFGVSIVLRRYTTRYHLHRFYHPSRTRNYALRAGVATTFYLVGIGLVLLDMQTCIWIRRALRLNTPAVLDTYLSLELVVSLAGFLAALFSGRALRSLWEDWARASRGVIPGSEDPPDLTPEQHVAQVVGTWIGQFVVWLRRPRQRRGRHHRR